MVRFQIFKLFQRWSEFVVVNGAYVLVLRGRPRHRPRSHLRQHILLQVGAFQFLLVWKRRVAIGLGPTRLCTRFNFERNLIVSLCFYVWESWDPLVSLLLPLKEGALVSLWPVEAVKDSVVLLFLGAIVRCGGFMPAAPFLKNWREVVQLLRVNISNH